MSYQVLKILTWVDCSGVDGRQSVHHGRGGDHLPGLRQDEADGHRGPADLQHLAAFSLSRSLALSHFLFNACIES